VSPRQRRWTALAAVTPSFGILAAKLPNLIEHRAEIVAALPDVLHGVAMLALGFGAIAGLAAAAAMGTMILRNRHARP